MTQPTDPDMTAGPNGDGSKSLARESKIGHLVRYAAAVLVLAGVDWLGDFDFTPLPDFVEIPLTALAPYLIGLATSWAVANRKTPRGPRF